MHFAESWNELHHLLIMEALGGNARWVRPATRTRSASPSSRHEPLASIPLAFILALPQVDRFFAQHTAVGLYWLTCLMYLTSPRMAYHLMELVEEHAFETYDAFLSSHGEELKRQPAPDVARRYYAQTDPYLFDEFQIGVPPGARRPEIGSLYDVFVAIRDDEGLHAHTMRLCQTAGAVRSPHEATGAADAAACSGVVECVVAAPTGWRADEPQREQTQQ